MFLQYLRARGLGHEAGRHAEFGESVYLVPMHGWPDLLYRVDPVVVSTRAVLEALKSRPRQTAFSDLLLRLGDGDLGLHELVGELDQLVFNLDNWEKKKTQQKKAKGKKKGKKIGKKKKKRKHVELTLSESIATYIETVDAFCKALDPGFRATE